tara:strand:+ start:292 stop:528 length:237 start_codon:yes stop_codon:yes gene_type:complete
MTEAQLVYFASPLIIYILGSISIAITAFFYLEYKEKKARFDNQWKQADKIEELEKKNKELSSVIVNNVRDNLKPFKTA